MAADRYSFNKSFEHIQNKFVGTGHSDITKFEWATNQHRDTLASHIGHSDMLAYFAVAQNDSIGRVRYGMLEVQTPSTSATRALLINMALFYHSYRKCCSLAVLLL